MAARDYPDDEFDQLGRHWVPEGAHRRPRPLWRTVLPSLIVLIVAPALAFLGVTYLAGLGDDAGPEPVATTEP